MINSFISTHDLSPVLSAFLPYLTQDLFLILVSIFFISHPFHVPAFLPKNYWIIMYLCPIVLSCFIEYNISTADIRLTHPDIGFILFGLLAFVMVICTYYISCLMTKTYHSMQETQFTNQKLLLQLDNFKRSSAMIEQIRIEKHELKNHYFYLQSLVHRKKYAELEQYLSSEICERLNIMEEFKTGNQFLDYLLTQKTAEARLAGINVTTSILLPASISIKEEDLLAILNNLLDNVIDACKKNRTKKYLFK